MRKIRSFCTLGQRLAKGQSLVETAIVAPILIFMLIGVFEVGWALRGYLVLVNVSRETTRFAVRPGYLDYTERPPTTGLTAAQQQEWSGINVGYNNVVNQMFNSMASQLNKTSTLSPALVISHLVIDTKYPCDPTAPINNCACNKFDPSNAAYDPNYGYTVDDLILHPAIPGYENYYAFTYDPAPTDTITYTTIFSYTSEAKKLAAANNKFNCELLKRTPSAVPSPNYVLITEMYYKQPQLLGFPLISNPFTNPVPMYGHTTMRMITSRTGNDIDKVGPVCIAIPFTIRNTYVNPAVVGVTVFDIMGGVNPELGLGNDRGFLGWDPQWQNVTDLDLEFREPRTSFNSYTNARVSSDHGLNVGDYVKSLPGNNDSATIRDHLDALIASGRDVIIPVWDQWDAGTSSYHISTFIKVRLVSTPAYHLTSNNPEVWAVYEGPATECLQ